MNEKIQLSVIISAYREEENLRIILPELKAVLDGLREEYEVLVIGPLDDALDNSKDVCNENGMVYLRREGGDLYGDAVRTGIKYARGEHILFMDADGSHSPEFVSSLYKYRKEFDVVVASRYVKGGRSENSSILIFMSFVINALYSIVLGLHCKDVSNSFKLYKKSQLDKLNLVSGNFDIIEEIFCKVKRQRTDLKVIEIPYTFRQRKCGRSKRNLVSFGLSYLLTLIRLRLMK